MLRTRLGQRYFSTTRGRMVLLLRRTAHTVDELTELLGITRNAVREHLATLERDGLVRRSGARRGDGKPAHLYALTPEAAELFPRGYAPVLGAVLDALPARLDPPSRTALFRDVAAQLIAGRLVPRGDGRDRVAAGAELLNDLGGFAEAREVDGTLVIQGWSCPLASVVAAHPELCLLAATALTRMVGLPVQERCDRREPPRCYFAVAASPEGTSRRARSRGGASPPPVT